MSRQNPASSSEPGKSALTPTMAIGSLRTGWLRGVDRSTLQRFQLAWRIGEQTLRNVESGCSKLLSAGERRRTEQQIQPYLRYVAILDWLQERARRPGVEGAHGRAAPDLIIHAASGVSGNRPVARQP